MTEQKDVFATFPYDGKLLAHFNGHFESIFIALQPFNWIEPEYQYILGDEFDDEQEDYDATLQEYLDYVKPFTWAEMSAMIGIDDIIRIEHVLRIRINQEYKDYETVNLIDNVTDKYPIFVPDADDFTPYFQGIMLQTLKYLGYEYVWESAEFDDMDREYHRIDDLIASRGIRRSSNLFTPDHKILIGAIHGITSVYICASQEMIEKMKAFYPLEGFYADEKTEVEWTFSLRDFYFFDEHNQQLEVDLTPQVFFEKILKIGYSRQFR